MKKINFLIALFLNITILNAQSTKGDFEKEFNNAFKKQSQVEIVSYTGCTAYDTYNLKLSEERAQNVVASFFASGISSDRMQAKGYGKTMPDSPNKKIKRKR